MPVKSNGGAIAIAGTRQSIEQRALPDVGASDESDGGEHGRGPVE